MRMTSTATNSSMALQLARAAHLRALFEPWSIRRLEARTGIGRGTLQGRLNGMTAITVSDIEILAPVIRMTPAELFAELLAVDPGNTEGPASGETGPAELPDLDSNQEPAGFRLAPITQLEAHREAKENAHDAVHSDHDATITQLRPAVGE